jgi:putative ABC transport system permease protein
MDMNTTLFEYDYGAINVCGIIDDLWMGNANSTDNDMLIWTVLPSEPQSLGNMISLVVKVNGDPDDAVRTIQEFYAREKPDLSVTVETYENIYRRTYTAEDRSLRITGLFALLTIVLTVMAMVAMSTYYARQRAKSTAVRKIMGCPRSEIYTHTLASFLSASLIAAVIAVPLIYTYTGRWLQTYSYHIGNYWWIYLLALLIVAAIAALAITYRAVQLMNTNPAIALRKD